MQKVYGDLTEVGVGGGGWGGDVEGGGQGYFPLGGVGACSTANFYALRLNLKSSGVILSPCFVIIEVSSVKGLSLRGNPLRLYRAKHLLLMNWTYRDTGFYIC